MHIKTIKCFILLAFFIQITNSLAVTKDYFSMPLEELMNIEIYSAGKAYEKIKNIPASVYIVTRSDIEKYGYTTLTDIVSNIPGVYNIYNYNGVSGNFGVRGFWNPKSQNSSVAILINGVSQLVVSDNDRSNPLERINVLPENIDRIEFIKGPMGVIYGNGASFGVINIITNESNNNFISASYGTRNSSKIASHYSLDHKHGTLHINASAYQTDGLNNKFSDMIGTQGEAILTGNIPPANIPAADATTEKLLEHEGNYLNISGSYDNWYFDISNNHSIVEAFFLVPPVENGDNRDTDVFTGALGIKNKINDWINTDTRITYNNYSLSRDFDGYNPGFIAASKKKYENYELEFLATLNPNKDLNIITGLNINKTDNYTEITNVPTFGFNNEYVLFDRTVQSLFLQTSYRQSEKLLFIAGLRSEHLKRYNRTVIEDFGAPGENIIPSVRTGKHNQSPRASIIYSFDSQNMLKFMYGKTIRYSNDKFLPETTKTYELNYLLTKNSFYSSISIFKNYLDNLLTDVLVINGAIISNNTSNSGEISTTGIEVILKNEFTDNLESEIGLTFQESTDKTSGMHIEASYSPDTLIHFKTSYTSENKIYSLQGRFVDSILPFLERTNSNPQGTFIGDKADKYMVWDINIRFNRIAPNLYASINIKNIFDEEIRYPNNLENSEFLAKGPIGEDRTIMGSVGWEF
jgi:outer membrane receptor protein involved in Fe transport